MIVPGISVIMSVYNGEKYLHKAIESILIQKFTNFEFIIINDGSTDKSDKIIRSYDDKRIVYIDNINNIGLIKSLNKGILAAKGKYIARMDADDISLPTRFCEQFDFMEKNHDITVCGTLLQKFPQKLPPLIWKDIYDNDEILASLLFFNIINHPTVIMRRDDIIDNKLFYDENFKHCEDYELWVRILTKKLKIAIIDKVLLKYRIHSNNISISNLQSIRTNSEKIRINLLSLFEISDISLKYAVHNIVRSGCIYNNDTVVDVISWFDELTLANNNKKIVNNDVLLKTLSRAWFHLCLNSCSSGLRMIKIYRACKYYRYYKLSLIQKIVFILMCILKMDKNNIRKRNT